MSNSKNSRDDRPIWLTSLYDADQDAQPAASVEDKLQNALRRLRYTVLAKRAGAIGLAAGLAFALWLPPKTKPKVAVEPVDESVMDVIAEVMSQADDDEADFIPTKLASEQPLESVRVVRVSLPMGALANYGVTVADSAVSGDVTADLLIGQDGIARAIRVVR